MTRPWLVWPKRLLAGAAVALGLAVAAGAAYEQLGRRAAARDFPPAGELVEVEGRRSHIHCQGEGSPTVVLEAGLDPGGSFAWAPVRSDLAAIARTCAYDRAGILWSQRGPEPRTAHRIADELHALLEAAGEAPPYVLVGHSLGGPLIRVFDARFEGEAAGFVFVDSSHPEQVERFPPEVQEVVRNRRSSPMVRVNAAIGITRLGMDPPRDVRAAHLLRTLPGFAAERVAIPTIFAQAAETGSLGSRPVVVLTAGTRPPNPDWSEETQAAAADIWFELQAELARLSTDSDHRTIAGAGHYIQVDAPEAVVEAVRDVVVAVRESSLVRREGGSRERPESGS